MAYLIDTNVISELRRDVPNSGVSSWFSGVADDEIYLSVLTLGEIRQGIEKLRIRKDRRAGKFEKWLNSLLKLYADRIIPIDSSVTDIWGKINAKHRIPVVDGLLAATAMAHGWTLVTRNVKDFARTGALVHNPFG
ncbi:MAG: type II toxin-antitoxin system VapC family toxin [Sciscionella sp.]|nr:type II toxin-antitoxin system VapC family toxin [Sciscionella sp.]